MGIKLTDNLNIEYNISTKFQYGAELMKILLLYPNFYGMNMLPVSIGIFTALLKVDGHEVRLFDTTVYKESTENGLDFDKLKSDNLNARPFDGTKLKELAKRTDPKEDFKKIVSDLTLI